MILKNTFYFLISLFSLILCTSCENIAQLPNCPDNHVPRLVLVSTIDGQFTAIDADGNKSWQIDTDPGPLLTSNIHNLELTNNGRWVRIIPSLSGTLYRFDGISIDQIPISAESLLKSSFKFTDDLVIAGGYEVRTYGVGFKTGTVFFTCSSSKCDNKTVNETLEDVLLIERNSQTVRAVESQSGNERWNFSVGHHNIKLPQITCINPQSNAAIWNISAIMPDGMLLSSSFQDNVKIDWQYQFPSPIVKVWKWDGRKLSEINLFAVKNTMSQRTTPSIYVGMHRKQLYIHEANNIHHRTEHNEGITEGTVVETIPWKPIPASGLLAEDDATALSVLYASEYVNGQGYYLYTTDTPKKKSNNTIKLSEIVQEHSGLNFTLRNFGYWKEIAIIVITVAIARYVFSSYFHHHQQKQVIFVDRYEEKNAIEAPTEVTVPFNSRYMNDFDTLRCLGRGGFGIVFEVKQKIDECHYAIKRITLPNEEAKRDAVMREVKALAKLEHNNIVRYFNSWVETPPIGWQKEHDTKWVEKDESSFATGYSSPSESLKSLKKFSEKSDSFIVFDNSTANANDEDGNTNEIKVTDFTETYNETCSSLEPFSNNANPVFLYIQMQLCQRQSLSDWLIANSQRSKETILNIFKQIISAVEYVHLQGLIHRDLKPSNIFFSMDGQIKVGDFGLVKDVADNHDHPNSYSPYRGHTKEVGTRLYMSPEQEQGKKYNYKVDIYSIGLIFFELMVYFSTDMERICTLNNVRNGKYPKDFIKENPDEHSLLSMMLCYLPEKRLTTFGVRARPPINDELADPSFDFDLPRISSKTLPKQVAK